MYQASTPFLPDNKKGHLSENNVVGQHLIARNVYIRFFNFSNSWPWHRSRGRWCKGKSKIKTKKRSLQLNCLGNLGSDHSTPSSYPMWPQIIKGEKNGKVFREHNFLSERWNCDPIMNVNHQHLGGPVDHEFFIDATLKPRVKYKQATCAKRNTT